MTKKRILLVDDEPHLTRLLKMQLERNSFAIVTASNGVDALAKLPSFQPDVVISDIQMPKMDGLELCRHIFALEVERPPFIFLVTSRTELEYRDWSRTHSKRVVFLEKPISVNALLRRLDAVFAEPADATP